MVPWGLIVFVVGILYGWLSPGRQNKGYLFKQGLVIGLVLALVLALIGWAAGANPLGLAMGDALGIFLAVVILTLLFILGAWIGDLIEGPTRKRV
jgi:VIT1/CCC1 family predicted Fe2+/Mn2+ transporter